MITDPINRLFRSSCSDCGSVMLEWGTVFDMLARVPLEQRTELKTLAGYAGYTAEAWRCVRCGHFGVFMPANFEPAGF